MRKKVLLFIALIGMCSIPAFAQQPSESQPTEYGAAFDVTPTLTPSRLPYVLKDQKALDKVSMAGTITEVCQKEGCWLKMTTDEKNNGEEVLVKMKGHAFLVPKDIAGKRAIVFGKIEKKEQSIKEQKHYLEDAGASQEAIDAVTAPRTTYMVIASGVKVFD